MRKQQQVWLKEHSSNSNIPALASNKPSSSVIYFTDYLKSLGREMTGKVIDIGSGKGRNSIYLAEVGFEVFGLEYIQHAIDAAQQCACASNIENRVHFLNTPIDDPWPFDDDTFSVAVDSFSSIDIETKDGRMVCRDEMFRTLVPGGYALVTVRSADDEWEAELMANHPGAEPNSTIWPSNGKFQKNYDEKELKKFFDNFNIIELKKTRKPAFLLGRHGLATNLWLILQKPLNPVKR